jgi:acetate kinase
LALNIFIDRIVGYVGNYFVKLDGQVDALVFAGGIGEKSAVLRSRVVEKCACLGYTIDEDKNSQPGEASVVEIGKEGKVRTLVCVTDEAVSRS